MLSIYSNIEYNVTGDTYLAVDGSTYYLIYSEYDQVAGAYSLSFIREVDMPSEHRMVIGRPIYADTYDDVIFVVEGLISKLVELVTSGNVSQKAIEDAWTEL